MASRKPPASAGGKKAGSKASAAADREDEEPRIAHTQENAVEKCAEIIGNDIIQNLENANWKTRLAAVESLANSLNKQTDVDAELFVHLLKDRPGWKENNFQVLVKAFSILKSLASRPSFTRGCAYLAIEGLIEKMGDIKVKTSSAEALTSFVAATSLQFVFGQTYPILQKSKNPKTLVDAIKWMEVTLMDYGIGNGFKTKPLVDFIRFSLDSSNAPVRSAAVALLGVLRIYMGQDCRRFFEDLKPALLSVIDAEFERVKDIPPKANSTPSIHNAVEEDAPEEADEPPPPVRKPEPKRPSTSSEKSKPAAAPAPAPTPAPAPAAASAPASKPAASASRKPPATSSARPAGGAASSAGSKKPGASKNVEKDDDPPKFNYSQEDIVERATEVFGGELIQNLDNSNWKIRLAAVESLSAKLSDPETIDAEMVVRLLKARPGWKDNNFQVLSKAFGILKQAAASPSFTRGCAFLCFEGLAEKLGDIKVKASAAEALIAFAEATSLQFVFFHVYPHLQKQKSPKVLADAIKWMETTLMEFGIGNGFKVKPLIDFIRFCLESSNAPVRTGAVGLLGVLRIYAGADIRSFFEDLKPALLSVIDAEFEKVKDVVPPKAIRLSKSAAQESSGPAASSSAASADVTDELFPRVDISGQITNKLLEEMGDGNWKVRKEALDNLQQILDTAKRILPNLGDLVGALKGRLGDSNKMLVIQTVNICGTIATAMGKPFERTMRPLLPLIVGTLADTKNTVRAAALQCMDAIVAQVDLEILIAPAAAALVPEKPDQRRDLLTWLAQKLEALPENCNLDTTPLVKPALKCLEDKNPDVRKAAQAAVSPLIKTAGVPFVRDVLQGMKASDATKFIAAAIDKFSREAKPAPTAAPASATASKSNRAASSAASAAAASVAAAPSSSNNVASAPAPSASAPVSAAPRKAVSSSSNSSTASAAMTSSTLTASNLPASLSSAAATSPTDDFAFLPVLPKGKAQRADRDKGLNKWTFETPRAEFTDPLREQMEQCFQPAIVSQLFSKDFKDHLTGMGTLDDTIIRGYEKSGMDEQQFRARCIAPSDLILKYMTIRFFDTNTTVLLKCLDLIEHLFVLMDEAEYHLSEYEASSFLPFFVNKVGDNKEPIRVRVRDIMHLLCRIYPASKFFAYLLDALKSKNSRTRSECLEEIGLLIQRHGISICTPPKCMPLIAVHISDRDNPVRTAALNSLVQAHHHLGDSLFKHIGRIPDKDRSLLDERIRRSGPVDPPPTSHSNSSSAAVSSTSSASAGAGAAFAANDRSELSASSQKSSSLAMSKSSASSLSSSSISMNHHHHDSSNAHSDHSNSIHETVMPTPPQWASKVPHPDMQIEDESNVVDTKKMVSNPLSSSSSSTSRLAIAAASRETSMDFLLMRITSGDLSQAVDALKTIEKLITKSPEKVQASINDIVSTITLQLNLCFQNIAQLPAPDPLDPTDVEDPLVQANARVCKHIVNNLSELFQNRNFARAMAAEILKQLLQELMQKLLDESVQRFEWGVNLNRTLNMLMIRILENTDRNMAFSVLIKILSDTCSKAPNGMIIDIINPKAQAFQSLVLKCIWKLTKPLKETLLSRAIRPNKLIHDIYLFYEAFPPEIWHRRMAAARPNEKPDICFRTVQTLFMEIIHVYDEGIFELFDLVPNPQSTVVWREAHDLLARIHHRRPQQQEQEQQQHSQQQYNHQHEQENRPLHSDQLASNNHHKSVGVVQQTAMSASGALSASNVHAIGVPANSISSLPSSSSSLNHLLPQHHHHHSNTNSIDHIAHHSHPQGQQHPHPSHHHSLSTKTAEEAHDYKAKLQRLHQLYRAPATSSSASSVSSASAVATASASSLPQESINGSSNNSSSSIRESTLSQEKFASASSSRLPLADHRSRILSLQERLARIKSETKS